jgi:hypothetical protein
MSTMTASHTEHNAPITWDQLLRQTSGWWGTLFDKPAWADRPARDDPTRDLVAGPPTRASIGNTMMCGSTRSRWRRFMSTSAPCTTWSTSA